MTTIRLWTAVATAALLSGCFGERRQEDKQTADTAAGVHSYTLAPTSGGLLGCQSRSTDYPWSRAELRTWTPRATQEAERPNRTPGTVTGAPFVGRLIQAYSEDYGDARQTVVIELENGCRRQFRAESFIDGDRAVIDAAVAAHPMAPDPASYAQVDRDGFSTQAMLAQGTIRVHMTQHFAIWYGTRTDGDFYSEIAQSGRSMEQVLQETGDWLEKQWLLNRDVLKAPMPYPSGSDRRKLDVYLCGTGRPNPWDDDMGECGSNASEMMHVSAWAVDKGSVTLVHEFGHMIQHYSGGFRDRDPAGVIWETGAEWNSFELNPIYMGYSASYLNQLENGFLFSPARYGAYPIFTYLYEKDNTRSLVFGTWQRNLRNADGASLEDYLPAFVRLGQHDGIYPRGFASFADDAGWYGARLVAMDFRNQRALLDLLRPTRTTTLLPHFYTPLSPVATANDPTVFASPAKRPLLEFGTHIVPLTSSGQQVRVTLTGGTNANLAAWRFTIVAVDANGQPSYAPMGAVVGKTSASTAMTPRAGTKLYLAVTATPYTYETLGWQENGKPIYGTRFPYRVKIQGATPRTGSSDACDPATQPGAWTTNYALSGNREEGRPCQ